MMKRILAAAIIAFAVGPALADNDARPSDAELANVTAALAKVGCKPGPEGVEKERAALFEVDDAQCEIGQYDIKLDGSFTITSMTLD